MSPLDERRYDLALDRRRLLIPQAGEHAEEFGPEPEVGEGGGIIAGGGGVLSRGHVRGRQLRTERRGVRRPRSRARRYCAPWWTSSRPATRCCGGGRRPSR